MKSTKKTAAEMRAAKRRWLNSHDTGYHKAMGNRHVQMIAIGGAIGTGLFLGAGGRLQAAGPALALIYLVCGIFSFFILRALGELVLHRPSSGSFVSYAREFLGEKAAYVAGWMYFVNWAMTGIVDITAVALYMHYWGAFGDVPQWVFALGALAIVGTMNMIGVKWFAEMEFWFALVKVLAIAIFLVVGVVFLGTGKPLDGNATGFHLVTDNGGLFPHGLLPALVLVQGVVFAFASQQRDLAHRPVLRRFGGAAGAAAAMERLSGRPEPVRDLLLEAGRALRRQHHEHRGAERGALQSELRPLLYRSYSAFHGDGRFGAEVHGENERPAGALRRYSGHHRGLCHRRGAQLLRALAGFRDRAERRVAGHYRLMGLYRDLPDASA